MTDNLNPFILGIIDGFGAYVHNTSKTVRLNIYKDYYTNTNELLEIINYIEDYIVIGNVDTGQYYLNITADKYLNYKSAILNTETPTPDTSKYIMGFINSNAKIVYDNGLAITTNNIDIFNTITSSVKTNNIQHIRGTSGEFNYVAIYRYPELLDLLNNFQDTSGYQYIVRHDLKVLRFNINTNSFYHRTNNSIQFIKLIEDAVAPSKSRASDTGYDVTLMRELKTVGDVVFYGTGIAVLPPDGYYFELVPRSSISKTNLMLANSVGIIDATYRGEIIVPVRVLNGNKPKLPAKLFQLVPKKLYHFDVIQVDSLSETSRNDGGFGSTG